MTQLRDTMQGAVSRAVLPVPGLGGLGGLGGILGGGLGNVGGLPGLSTAYGLLATLLGTISGLVSSLLCKFSRPPSGSRMLT
jgi:hypothetical protein